MKISDAGRTAGPRSKRRVAGAGQDHGGDGFTIAEDRTEARPGAAITPAAPLAALGGILAVQEVADRSAERRRAIARGDGLLDELAALRVGLLDGQVRAATLDRLGRLLGESRSVVDDAGLAALLDEIEIRAAVELAKLERARTAAGTPTPARDETWPDPGPAP